MANKTRPAPVVRGTACPAEHMAQELATIIDAVAAMDDRQHKAGDIYCNAVQSRIDALEDRLGGAELIVSRRQTPSKELRQ